MSVDSGPNDQHNQQVDLNAEQTATRLDDALAHDPELGEPARRLTRSATDALGLAEDTLAHAGMALNPTVTGSAKPSPTM